MMTIKIKYVLIGFVFLISGCSSVTTKNKPIDTSIPSFHKTSCPNWQSGETIKIKKSITIPKGCSYQRVSFLLDKDNITFDCQGSVLNGLTKNKPNSIFVAYSKTSEPRNWAFLVHTSGVNIKNCHIKNYIDGIVIKYKIPKDKHRLLRKKTNVVAIEKQLRQNAPQNITISKTKIHNSHKHGIYMQRYVNNVKFDNGEIKYSGNSAIYLESGTRNNEILNSYFYKNGYTNYKRKHRMRMPKYPTGEREAIAIDSSAYNKIIANTFKNNGKGAIFLYKNCFEKHKNIRQLPRFQHSNYNQIEANTFINERYGVWLASRQSKQLSRFKCGDPLMYKSRGLFGIEKYYHDYAKYNQVLNNTFRDVVYGITIEDDKNKLIDNKFSGNASVDIKIGTPYRVISEDDPVKDTILKGNIRQDGQLKLRFTDRSK